MKKITIILPIIICVFLIIFDSCYNTDNNLAPYNFGYIKIINNTNNIYGIQIDSSYSYYCNEIRPKRSITCDLPVGWHNIQIDTVYNNKVYITLDEVTVISLSK